MSEWKPRRLRAAGRSVLSGVLAAVICYLLVFMPLPYYIFQPGTAENIGPMVHVQGGGTPEKGMFMLTTVGVTHTNALQYVYARLRSYEIHKITDVRKKGESEKEYNQRQEFVMLTSQSSAIQAAYLKAGVPFRIQNEGVTVLQVMEGMPAYGVLAAGDHLLELDSRPLQQSNDLLQYLKGKKAGDSVKLSYKRGTEVKSADLRLALLPKEEGQQAEKAGIGVVPADMQSVRAEQEDKQVTVQAGEIGGPSAGFMFAMEIYNQLTPEDWTKGYRIAGTGTIDPQGNIGVIGGINHKVVAAHREKADIFFAPKDFYPSEGQQIEPVKNTTDAVKQAEKIGTKMKIVPVGTMDEALKYLESLPSKGS